MFKKILLSILFVLCLPVGTSLANRVMMGKTEGGATIFLDADISPVAYVDKEGARVMAHGIFTENYFLYSDDGRSLLTINSIYDAKANRTMTEDTPDWLEYKEGGDGFLFGAYVVRDYVQIMSSRPFLLKSEYVPRTREQLWPADANGWRKVYERKDGSQAWVQTKSAVLSYPEPDKLPHVRLLVRRLETNENGETRIFFTYESYDPEKRTRQILKVWDEDRRETESGGISLYEVPVLSKDAAIASHGYMVFMLDYEQTKRRVQFIVGEEPLFIRDSWFDF